MCGTVVSLGRVSRQSCAGRVHGCSLSGSREGDCIGFCIGSEWQLQRVLHDGGGICVLVLHPVQPFEQSYKPEVRPPTEAPQYVHALIGQSRGQWPSRGSLAQREGQWAGHLLLGCIDLYPLATRPGCLTTSHPQLPEYHTAREGMVHCQLCAPLGP